MTRAFRYASALLVLGGGAFHLSLYFDGYRSIPTIGPLFLLNVAIAVVLAVALVVRPLGAFAAAALGFSVLTAGAFLLTRTVGFLGHREAAWTTSSAGALATEVLGAVVLALWFVSTRPAAAARPVLGTRITAATA